MGIINIKVLTEPEIRFDDGVARQVQAAQAALVTAHRMGKHSYGEMRRECPLCQAQR